MLSQRPSTYAAVPDRGLPRAGPGAPITPDVINKSAYETSQRTIRSAEGGLVNTDGNGTSIRFPKASPNFPFRCSIQGGKLMMVNGAVFWCGSEKFDVVQVLHNGTTGLGNRGGEYLIPQQLGAKDRNDQPITNSADENAQFIFLELAPVDKDRVVYIKFPTMFEPLQSVLDFLVNKGYQALADRLEQAGLPEIVSFEAVQNALVKDSWLDLPAAIVLNMSNIMQEIADFFKSLFDEKKPELGFDTVDVYNDSGLYAQSVCIAIVLANSNEVVQNVFENIFEPPAKKFDLGISLPSLQPTELPQAYQTFPFKVTIVNGGLRIEEGRVTGYNMLEWWDYDDWKQAEELGEPGAVKWGVETKILLSPQSASVPVNSIGNLDFLLNSNDCIVTIPGLSSIPASNIWTQDYSIYLKFERVIEPSPIGPSGNYDTDFTLAAWYLTPPQDIADNLRVSEGGESEIGQRASRLKSVAPWMQPKGDKVDPTWNPDTWIPLQQERDFSPYNQRWKVTVNVKPTALFRVDAFFNYGQPYVGRRKGSYGMGGWAAHRPGNYVQADWGWPYNNIPAEYPRYNAYVDVVRWACRWVFDIFSSGGYSLQNIQEERSRYAYSFWDGGAQYYEIARVVGVEGTYTDESGQVITAMLNSVRQFIRSDFFFYPPPDVYWTQDELSVLDFVRTPESTHLL